MAYRVSEIDICNYYRDGYIVFRQILPTSLIVDLRRECDKGRDAVRKQAGQQAQRFQPITKYADLLDTRPFQDYAQLPALRDAFDQVMSPRHAYGKLDVMGVLLEPAEQPWCTNWHRDMTHATSRLPVEEFQNLMLDWETASQINCPLYDDDCTWFVPGSHLRAMNLPGEEAAAVCPPGVGWTDKADEDPVERERQCFNYAAGMPNAVQLKLNAGDLALYRALGWHIGNYVPYKKRATLHDVVMTSQFEKWWREWIKGGSPRWTRRADTFLEKPATANA